MNWYLQKAKNKFPDIFNSVFEKGAQKVRDGKRNVVLISGEEYKKLINNQKNQSQKNSKTLMKKEAIKTNLGFTKDFNGQVTNLKNSYLLSFSIIPLFQNQKVLEELKNYNIHNSITISKAYDFHFSQFLTFLNLDQEDKRDFTIIMNEYMMSCTRIFLIGAYECFKGDNIIFEKVKEEKWFNFLRAVRNAVAHGINGIWDFSFSKEIQEFEYRRKLDSKIVILKKEDLQGKKMSLNDLGNWETLIDLPFFLEDYVKKELEIQNMPKT